jgi:hypothetical protein
MGASDVGEVGQVPQVVFDTHPSRYAHWKLAVDGEIAPISSPHCVDNYQCASIAMAATVCNKLRIVDLVVQYCAGSA